MARAKNIVMENARIIFRNFAGKGDKFNPSGRRTFAAIINPEDAQALADEGWHVKTRAPKEEGEEPLYYLPIRVSFDVSAPAMYIVTRKKKTLLTDKTVQMLDNAELENVDLVISPYHWTMPNGDSGITAYLKTGYFKIVEDVFYDKYSKYDDPESEDEEIPFAE